MTRVQAVLFHRDGVLLEGVPRSPDEVRPASGAAETLWQLRRHGLRTGVITLRGPLTEAETRRVDTRVDELLGPFDVWAVCPHAADEDCHCCAPQPALLLWAAGRLCTAPAACALVGDTAADAEAAQRVGARALLLPTRGNATGREGAREAAWEGARAGKTEAGAGAGGSAAQIVADLPAVARALVPETPDGPG
ncbi:HAD-IIIA family hydrolase [Streptomyces pharetrae]|uniref:HAD-IIIA family hydrolase n=1 Tax=Streptomyces pharetrae TaxID=291370 RepID=UPI00334B011B